MCTLGNQKNCVTCFIVILCYCGHLEMKLQSLWGMLVFTIPVCPWITQNNIFKKSSHAGDTVESFDITNKTSRDITLQTCVVFQERTNQYELDFSSKMYSWLFIVVQHVKDNKTGKFYVTEILWHLQIIIK